MVADAGFRNQCNPAAEFAGRDGNRFRWIPTLPGAKWPVDARTTLNDRGGLAYSATILLSPRAQPALLHFASGDKLEAFLNGVKIITLDDHSAHGAPTPIARVRLHAGRNELLVKFSDGGGGWGFVAAVEADDPVTHQSPNEAR